jgi:4-amino-4-deoxy-L-arabinose transferase-like glycosyltransferase
MTDTASDSIREQAATGERTREAMTSKIAWALLILITLYVCYFSHLGAFGLVGPDEPRYAWIARDIAETGDWVTPRLYDKPWFEKPVLYYWSAALSFKMFGVSEATARLPSAVSALLATLALAWLAFRMEGRNLARWLLVLMPSTVAMIGFTHAASPDMLFSAMLTLAMVCAAVATGLVAARMHGYASLFLFGFFLGAAALAKGPAALILAGGAIFLWAALTKRWREAMRLFHPIAVGAFLITAMPWYVACARRNPDFFRVFIIEHNFNRYLTPEFQHLQPFWYYVPITLAALLPWVCWLAWFALREGRTWANTSERTQISFFTAWALFPVLFFSLSKSKLPGYILPAVGATVFLIAWAVTRSLNAEKSFRRFPALVTGLLFLSTAVATAILTLTPSRGSANHWAVLIGGTILFIYMIVAGFGGLLISAAALLRRTRMALICAAILQLALLTLAYSSLSNVDAEISARNAARQIEATRADQAYAFRLQRGWQYQVNFYLHREIAEWNPGISGEAVVITPEKHLAELRREAEILSIVSDRSKQAEIVLVKPLKVVSAASTRNIPGGGEPR